MGVSRDFLGKAAAKFFFSMGDRVFVFKDIEMPPGQDAL
jgi:hypothetical protein